MSCLWGIIGSLQCSTLWFLGIKKSGDCWTKRGGDINCTVALWVCVEKQRGGFDHIMAWQDGMYLAHSQSNPRASSFLLWSGTTSGNNCSWHKSWVAFYPLGEQRRELCFSFSPVEKTNGAAAVVWLQFLSTVKRLFVKA